MSVPSSWAALMRSSEAPTLFSATSAPPPEVWLPPSLPLQAARPRTVALAAPARKFLREMLVMAGPFPLCVPYVPEEVTPVTFYSHLTFSLHRPFRRAAP